MKKWILQLGLVLLSSFAIAQTSTPPPVAAYINGGGGWNPWSAASGFGALGFTPPGVALYCSPSLNVWQPCNPTGGGGGGATLPFPGIVYGTSASGGTIATTEQITAQIPCPLQNATNLCATRPPYNMVGDGVTDNTAAYLAAITAIAATPGKTGTIWMPDGVYLVGTTLLDPGCANAVLPMPKIPNYGLNTLVDISIKGFTIPSWNTSPSGFVLKSLATTGNIIGGCDSSAGGGFPNFTNVKLDIENATISLPVNSGAVAINASNLLAFQYNHLLIDTPGSGTTIPTSVTGGGVFMPQIANEVQNEMHDSQCGGLYTCYKITEHTVADHIHAAYSHDCFVFDNGTTSASVGDYENNTVVVTYLWEQNCVNGIVGPTGPFHSPIKIVAADLEAISGNGVIDVNNQLYGKIDINIPSTAGNTTNPCNANVVGGIHLIIDNLPCPKPPFPAFENWPAQEGQGTKFANAGGDFSNTVTTTNVTYTSVAGFPRSVATFNGTTSTALAASGTNTAFDGATPFSVCADINPTNAASGTGQAIMSNLSASPTFKGWTFSILSNWIIFGVISDFSTSNAAYARTLNAVVKSNITQKVCAAYDGSGSTNGIYFSINGTPTPTLSEFTPLTASAATTNPVSIGYIQNVASNAFAGAIGNTQIFNYMLPIGR